METKVNLVSPVGRIVMGSLYKPNTTDFDGKPLVVKTGPNAGQPRSNYFFALAIPKTGENHWANVPPNSLGVSWGRRIWEVGNTAFPAAAQRNGFAWKIEDGDSVIPNKKGRKPCDNEGWPGHWVLKFSGGFAPKIYKQEGGAYLQVTEPDFVKCGYYVEVSFSVDGNGQAGNPGVYLNHSLVCFRAYGTEISFGPDVNEVGFGQSPLPAGATLVPAAGSIPMPTAGPQSALPAAGPVPVTPNLGFVQVQPPAAQGLPALPQYAGMPSPGASVAASPSPQVAALASATPPSASPSNLPPPPPAGPQMTAKAAGVTREAFLQGGWTDAQLVAQGYMTV